MNLRPTLHGLVAEKLMGQAAPLAGTPKPAASVAGEGAASTALTDATATATGPAAVRAGGEPAWRRALRDLGRGYAEAAGEHRSFAACEIADFLDALADAIEPLAPGAALELRKEARQERHAECPGCGGDTTHAVLAEQGECYECSRAQDLANSMTDAAHARMRAEGETFTITTNKE